MTADVLYLDIVRDTPHPDDERWLEDYRDMWLAVLKLTIDDFRSGIRNLQHQKLEQEPLVHASREDARRFYDWFNAAHWLLSDDDCPRSFLWLMAHLRIDPELIRSRLPTPWSTQ